MQKAVVAEAYWGLKGLDPRGPSSKSTLNPVYESWYDTKYSTWERMASCVRMRAPVCMCVCMHMCVRAEGVRKTIILARIKMAKAISPHDSGTWSLAGVRKVFS